MLPALQQPTLTEPWWFHSGNSSSMRCGWNRCFISWIVRDDSVVDPIYDALKESDTSALKQNSLRCWTLQNTTSTSRKITTKQCRAVKKFSESDLLLEISNTSHRRHCNNCNACIKGQWSRSNIQRTGSNAETDDWQNSIRILQSK